MKKETIDLWAILSAFFQSNPMYSILSVINIVGFIITITVYTKVKNINRSIKSTKKLEKYKSKYEDIKNILESTRKDKPSDIYDRVSKLNEQLFFNISCRFKRRLVMQYAKVDKTDMSFIGLKSYIDDVIISLERNI